MIRGHFYRFAYRRPMQSLVEFAPPVAFLIAYYLGGIYVATEVLMATMAFVLIVDYARNRRISPMHALSAVLIFLFGSATLLLHNERFIQWKPTIFFWLASIAFLASFWIGKCTLVQRLLSVALGGEDSRISPAVWRRLNALWVVFYTLLGGLNLLVAFNASERMWVNFKVFGLTLATIAFVTSQVVWLTRRMEMTSSQPSAPA
jgi:intracellular septation protein